MKLKYDRLLSNFAFNCKLRHYTEVIRPELPLMRWMQSNHAAACDALKPRWGLVMEDAQRPAEKEMRENSRSRSAILHVLRKTKAGPDTSPHFSST